MKYKEDEILDEIKKYIESTYNQHYVGENGVQSLDLIFSAGHGEGFVIGNILKYAARYGRKKGKNRDDLLKVLHYGILSLYLNSLEQKQQDLKAEEISNRTYNGSPLKKDAVKLLTEPVVKDLDYYVNKFAKPYVFSKQSLKGE